MWHDQLHRKQIIFYHSSLKTSADVSRACMCSCSPSRAELNFAVNSTLALAPAELLHTPYTVKACSYGANFIYPHPLDPHSQAHVVPSLARDIRLTLPNPPIPATLPERCTGPIPTNLLTLATYHRSTCFTLVFQPSFCPSSSWRDPSLLF